MNRPSLSLVVPCYNEEASIPIFYQTVSDILAQMKLDGDEAAEFVFVDDGSSDNTLLVLRELSAQDQRVKYISFSRNFGKEAALFAGLSKSLGTYTVALDADLQHPPSLLPQMYELIQQPEIDCVEGRRTTRTNEPVIRTWLTRLFYKILSKMSEVPIEDGSGDFRMMSIRYKSAVLSLCERNRFSKGIFPWVGFKTEKVYFENTERVAGETKWSFKKLLMYSLDGILGFSSKPLLFSAIAGIAFLFISILSILFLIARKIIFDNSIEGWASLMCVILFLAGIQLFAIGIMGIYLSKMNAEIKQRPLYITKEEK